MARIPFPDPETLSEQKRQILSSGDRVLNVSRMVMHTPDAFWAPQRALGRAAMLEASIDPRERELVVLLVAHLSGSEYELYHHQSIAAALGITRAENDALERGDFATFSPRERDLCVFVTQLVRDVSPDDDALAAMRAHYPLPAIFEILFIACTYMTVARVAGLTGVEIEDEAVVSWK